MVNPALVTIIIFIRLVIRIGSNNIIIENDRVLYSHAKTIITHNIN